MQFSLRTLHEETRDSLSLFVLCLLCYFDKILLGPYAVIDFYDAIEVHFSHFKAMAELWWSYGPFSWYPFHAGGAPSFVGQHPPWHPAVFLAGIMPIWLLGLVWNVGQMFLAGYGMYRFLLVLPRTSRPVALVLGALSSLIWVSGNVHMVMPYAFPAMFAWTVDLFRADLGRLKRFRSALFILTVSLFSYPVLTLPHFPILHLALVLFMGRHLPNFRWQVAGVFLVWTGYVLLYVPSIVSLFLYIPYAQRDWNFSYPGLWPAMLDFLKWLKGRLGDQPLLALLLFGLPLLGKRSVRLGYVFLFTVLVVSGTFSSELKGLFAGSFLLKMDLFMFATTQGILAFLIAALVLEAYTKDEKGFSRWWLAPSVAVLPAFGAAHKVITFIFVLGTCVAAVALLRRDRDAPSPARLNWLMVGLVVCLCGTGMMIRQQFMTIGMFVPYAKGYQGHPALDELARQPRTAPFRVACLDVHPAVIQARGLDTVGGKSPLFNKYYKEYVREAIRPQLETPERVRQFDDLWRQLYLTRNQIDHDQRSVALNPARPRTAGDFNWPLLLAMNVTHVVATAPVPGMELLAGPPVHSPGLAQEKPWLKGLGLERLHDLPLWIYPLKNVRQRAYLSRPVVLGSDADVLTALGKATAEELGRMVFVARQDTAHLALPAEVGGQDAPGQVRIVSWTPDRIVLEGVASEPCVLMVSNNYDPRWQAESQGHLLPVFRANHAFQGVAIDRAGPFSIDLTFKSPLIWWLNLASLVGVVLLFSGIGLRRRGEPSALENAGLAPLSSNMRLCLLSGLSVALVWALTFYFFTFLKQRGPQVETYSYALGTIPLIGVGIALWCRGVVHRL